MIFINISYDQIHDIILILIRYMIFIKISYYQIHDIILIIIRYIYDIIFIHISYNQIHSIYLYLFQFITYINIITYRHVSRGCAWSISATTPATIDADDPIHKEWGVTPYTNKEWVDLIQVWHIIYPIWINLNEDKIRRVR